MPLNSGAFKSGEGHLLRLAETLTTFLTRPRSSADALDISERQRVLRLLVKEILVGDDKIVIRYCIPLPTGGNGPRAKSANAAAPSTEGYLFDNRVRHEVAGIEWYQRNAASRRHQRKGHRQDAAGRGTGSSDASRPIRGAPPMTDLVLGYSEANTSPLLKFLLSKVEDLNFRVSTMQSN